MDIVLLRNIIMSLAFLNYLGGVVLLFSHTFHCIFKTIYEEPRNETSDVKTRVQDTLVIKAKTILLFINSFVLAAVNYFGIIVNSLSSL